MVSSCLRKSSYPGSSAPNIASARSPPPLSSRAPPRALPPASPSTATAVGGIGDALPGPCSPKQNLTGLDKSYPPLSAYSSFQRFSGSIVRIGSRAYGIIVKKLVAFSTNARRKVDIDLDYIGKYQINRDRLPSAVGSRANPPYPLNTRIVPDPVSSVM